MFIHSFVKNSSTSNHPNANRLKFSEKPHSFFNDSASSPRQSQNQTNTLQEIRVPKDHPASKPSHSHNFNVQNTLIKKAFNSTHYNSPSYEIFQEKQIEQRRFKSEEKALSLWRYIDLGQTKQSFLKNKNFLKRVCKSQRNQSKIYLKDKRDLARNQVPCEPIHSRRSDRFRVLKGPLSSQVRSQQKKNNSDFIAIQQEKLHNFNDYSMQYIQKIQKEVKRSQIKARFNSLNKNRKIPELSNPSKKDKNSANKLRDLKLKQFQIRQAKKDNESCRPWSNLSFDLQEEYLH